MISRAIAGLETLGRLILFQKELFVLLYNRGVRAEELATQIWKVTIQSAPTTTLAGFFVGAIMSVQFAMQMAEFGALGYLGGLSTSGTIREVGPLLIAFMLSGKVGAYTSAELGTLRITEQIDAIRCLGANPLEEIILPRFIAIVVSSFFLLIFGLIASVFGGALLGQLFAGVNPQEYLRHIPTIVDPISIASGLFKCLVFSGWLALVCCYFGYHTTGGARGVGKSVVLTAVITMVGIVVWDWLTSLLWDLGLRSMGYF